MTTPTAKTQKIFVAVICIIAWLACGLQLYILISNASTNGLTVPVTISRFFGYFTILTNLLVALSLTAILHGPGYLYRFFSKPVVKTAIAVYIFIVCLGYNLLLRQLWQPQGLQLIADELLHDVVPLLYVLYWLVFVPKSSLRWRLLPGWLAYPFIYLVYALLRGAIDGFYAYPFINAAEIGYAAVFQNAFFLLLAFIIVSLLFIQLGRVRKR